MRPPDITGVGAWRAWRCKLPTSLERPDQGAHLAGWLLFCPGAHAAWSYWWIALIHLRPIDGAPPAVIKTPGAGWEMMSLAQHPDTPPLDWVVQFGDVLSDHEAIRVAGAVVDAILKGEVSPDSDFRSFWEKTIPATAKHFAEGAHPDH